MLTHREDGKRFVLRADEKPLVKERTHAHSPVSGVQAKVAA